MGGVALVAMGLWWLVAIEVIGVIGAIEIIVAIEAIDKKG